MNTIHRPDLEAAQRIYERTLTAAQRKHRMGVIDPLGVSVAPQSDATPWDLPQECPKIAPGSNMASFEGENEQCSEKDAQNALEPFNGHTASQIAYSALVLLGCGLLCLLAGLALGVWIALERFGL